MLFNETTLWITGGLPQITQTTELVTLADDKLKVDFGPDLPMPLFGHCIVAINDSFMIIGGYSEVPHERWERNKRASGIFCTELISVHIGKKI